MQFRQFHTFVPTGDVGYAKLTATSSLYIHFANGSKHTFLKLWTVDLRVCVFFSSRFPLCTLHKHIKNSLVNFI
jgi:hypothetical protein